MSGANNVQTTGLRAGELEPVFRRAGVLREELERAKSVKSKATLIGNFLSKNLNREVAVEVNGRLGKAVVKQELGAARAKFYRIEVSWTDPAVVPPGPQAPSDSSTLGTVVIPTAADVVAAAATCPHTPTVSGSESTLNTSGNAEAW